MADTTAHTLKDKGLAQLIDVYGTAETGAIGTRDVPERGYTLSSRWQLSNNQHDVIITDRHGHPAPVVDRIRPLNDRRFELLGRRDHAVQVGGSNVYPPRVADRLRTHDDVADAAVRLGSNGRLKAFIVPANAVDDPTFTARLHGFIEDELPPPERPTRLTIGPVLPTNAMGKPAD